MKKLMSLVLCAFVLSIASASIGCGETAKKVEPKAGETGREKGPADGGKGGTPPK